MFPSHDHKAHLIYPHKFIEQLSPILLDVFVKSGLWKGVSVEEMDEFAQSLRKDILDAL